MEGVEELARQKSPTGMGGGDKLPSCMPHSVYDEYLLKVSHGRGGGDKLHVNPTCTCGTCHMEGGGDIHLLCRPHLYLVQVSHGRELW